MSDQQIVLTLNPDQYTKARAILISNSEVTSHVETDANSGSFGTSQVSMSYVYTPNSLVLSDIKKFGIARFASLGTIQSHLTDLLAQVN
jgi:hypothetical protein